MITVNRPIDKKESAVMDPKKFNLWLAIIGSTMLFAALTSAYIVKRAEGNWNQFAIPQQFIYSTVIAILASISMQWAYFSAKRDELGQLKVANITTLLFGLGFLGSQFMGWSMLVDQGLYIFFTDDVASSFFYVITALHFTHVVGGLIALVRVMYKTYKLEVHRKNMRAIAMCTTYWHFMGVLWIYLYLFLFLNR